MKVKIQNEKSNGVSVGAREFGVSDSVFNDSCFVFRVC
jgi:hypothetical protein